VSVDRFSTPLYGIGEAAAYLDVPSSTLATWAYGYERRRPGAGVVAAGPVITPAAQLTGMRLRCRSSVSRRPTR